MHIFRRWFSVFCINETSSTSVGHSDTDLTSASLHHAATSQWTAAASQNQIRGQSPKKHLGVPKGCAQLGIRQTARRHIALCAERRRTNVFLSMFINYHLFLQPSQAMRHVEWQIGNAAFLMEILSADDVFAAKFSRMSFYQRIE